MNPTLILTRGLPASGKTTRALAWVSAEPGRARSNRDDLRASVFGRTGVLDHDSEEAITRIQRDMVSGLLASGLSVVVDDMNLRARYGRAWADLAVRVGADLDVWDLTDVPLEECLRRDRQRAEAGGRAVGEKTLRDLHGRFLAAGRLTPITPTDATQEEGPAVYVPDESLPKAWIFDVDGTLAHGHFGEPGRRGPFDWSRVGEDDVALPVVRLAQSLASGGDLIIVMSGRSDRCRAETGDWLVRHNIPHSVLLMRKDGDFRPDEVVKAELFAAHVSARYNVLGIVDDRAKVVAMWRRLGLLCAQVAPGDF